MTLPGPRQRGQSTIASAMDILFTVLVLYTFAQWTYVATVPARILYIFTVLVIVNDWLSFRATADVYTGGMFTCDLLIAFIIANLIHPLSVSGPLGYEVSYWLYFASLCLVYVIWDAVVASFPETSKERRRSLRGWMVVMLINGILALAAYCIQAYFLKLSPVYSALADAAGGLGLNGYLSGDALAIAAQWIPVLPAGMFSVTLIFWNRQKFTWFRRQRQRRRTTAETAHIPARRE